VSLARNILTRFHPWVDGARSAEENSCLVVRITMSCEECENREEKRNFLIIVIVVSILATLAMGIFMTAQCGW